MLYKKTKELTKEVFANPGSEYRGTPFWAWNCRMDKENIDRTIESLKAMGMGGGHIHCRTGMDHPYMGEEFLSLVKYSNQKYGQTLIMITHDENIALQADRILAIEDGQITRDEVIRR